MTKRTKRVVAVGAVVAAVAIGGGAAVAASSLGDDREAFLKDVAKRLNVTPTELESALQGAYAARIDAAVADGKLTKEQGEALKQRAKANGGVPFFGGPGQRGPDRAFGRPGFGHAGASLDAAATYLGLTTAELRSRLGSGTSLAQVAKDEGKSVDGLKKAITADLDKRLDAAVKDGKLTRAQADEVMKRASEHLDDLVNGTFKTARGFGGRGFHGHFGGGMPDAPPRTTAFA